MSILKAFISAVVACFLTVAFLAFVTGAVYLDLWGLPPVAKGLISAVSAVFGVISFFMVIAVLNDPYCKWQLIGPDGQTLAEDDGPLLGNDNARGFGKAASTNAMSQKGYVDASGGTLRFLPIADDGEEVRGKLNILRLRKEYSVTLTLFKLPVHKNQLAEIKAQRAKKEQERKAKEREELKALFLEAIQEALS